MKSFILLAIGFFLTAIVTYGQSSEKKVNTNKPDNWLTFEQSEYLIQYPDTFDIDKSGQMGMSFILRSRQVSQQDLFMENINLMVQDLSGKNLNFDQYVKISEDQIKILLGGNTNFESERLSKDGREYQKVVFAGKQGNFNLKWQQLYWLVNNKAYVLTLTCEENQYEKYLPLAEKIIGTFRLKLKSE